MNNAHEAFSVGAVVADPGTTAAGYCSVEIHGRTLRLPVVIVHGERPGPVLAVTAGIHGGEYVSMVAVREFVFGLNASAIQGTVIASLQSSPLSFQGRSAFVNPMDGKNLNRAFPGNPDGGSTDRLAFWLWSNVISRADYYVDCHSGDIPEALESFAGVSPVGTADVDDLSRELADQFDVPRIVLFEAEGSSIRAAAKAGIPSTLIEVGGEGRWSAAEVAIQHEGLRRTAGFAGLLELGREERKPLPVFENQAVMCEVPGLWYSNVKPGSFIDAGALLGVVEDPFGTVLQEARSPISGVLLYGLSSLAANEGDLIACIARPKDVDASATPISSDQGRELPWPGNPHDCLSNWEQDGEGTAKQLV
ncbi:succinylglutamate desuccinylase/aspartoacylase family protein [Arthrobacter sp. R4-81]